MTNKAKKNLQYYLKKLALKPDIRGEKCRVWHFLEDRNRSLKAILNIISEHPVVLCEGQADFYIKNGFNPGPKNSQGKN